MSEPLWDCGSFIEVAALEVVELKNETFCRKAENKISVYCVHAANPSAHVPGSRDQ